MDLLEHKSADDLHKSILAEISKAQNELKCATGDVKKASSRLSFALVALNELINRGID